MDPIIEPQIKSDGDSFVEPGAENQFFGKRPKAQFPSKKLATAPRRLTQLQILFVTILGIFLAEILAMLVLYWLKPFPYYLETIVDAIIMTGLIFPIIYFLSYKPLLANFNKQRQAEIAALSRASQVISAHYGFQDTTRAIFDACKNLIAATSGYVALIQEGQYVPLFIEIDGTECTVDASDLMPFRGLREKVYQSGKAHFENNFVSSEWNRYLPKGHIEIKNALFVPIDFEGNVVGVMGLANKSGGFTDYDGRIATIFCEIVAASLVDERAQQALCEKNVELDLHIQKRTQELESANVQLMEANRAMQADLVERKLVEAQLRSLTTALEATANGVVITDRRGNIRWANPAFSNMTGYPIEEILGCNLRFLKSGEHDSAFYKNLWETVLKGKVWRGEISNRRKDGSIYIEEQTITPLRDESWQISDFIAIKQDVTERKQAEHTLKQSEELLRTILQALPVGVWIIDETGNVVQGNAASRELWAGERYVGIEQYGEYKGWWAESGMLIPPEDWAAARAIREGTVSLNEEVEIECFDGVHKFILNSAVPIRNLEHKIIGAVVVNQDITERKKAEKLLELERSKLSNILSTMPDGVYIVNNRYEIEYINPVIEREFGPIEDHTCYEYFHERAEPCPWCKNQEVFSGSSVNWEWYSSKTGKSYDLFDTPLRNSNGSISKLEIFHDITERKRAQAELERNNKELQALSNAEYNARLFAETLSEVSQVLSQTLNLETVMNTLLDFIYRLVPFDSAHVALFEGESLLSVRASRGIENSTNSSQPLNQSLSVSGSHYLQSLFSTQACVLIEDTQQDSRWKPIFGEEHIRNWLGIQLVADDHVIGLCSLEKSVPGFFTPEHIRLAEAVVRQAAVAVQNAWLFEQVRLGRERLQSLSRRLVEVQEQERRYIARELHDEASQALTSLLFGFHIIEQAVNEPARLHNELERLKGTTGEVLNTLHRLAMDLRPASLDHAGLVPTLRQLIQNQSEQSGIDFQFKNIGYEFEKCSPETEINLYRIVQEAITNVVRHAHASHVDVILELRKTKIRIIIEDNGIGFDKELIGKSGHLGLVGMQERIEMLGGTLALDSIPAFGTTIVVEVPYGG